MECLPAAAVANVSIFAKKLRFMSITITWLCTYLYLIVVETRFPWREFCIFHELQLEAVYFQTCSATIKEKTKIIQETFSVGVAYLMRFRFGLRFVGICLFLLFLFFSLCHFQCEHSICWPTQSEQEIICWINRIFVPF